LYNINNNSNNSIRKNSLSLSFINKKLDMMMMDGDKVSILKDNYVNNLEKSARNREFKEDTS
jgi:hypothetical protein